MSQVDREYRIISALHKVNYPVPRPLLHCTDTSIIGTEFYVMEYVPGRIFRDLSLTNLPPQERTAIYKNLVETLALLHTIDWKSIGLDGYGGRNRNYSYCERQVCFVFSF